MNAVGPIFGTVQQQPAGLFGKVKEKLIGGRSPVAAEVNAPPCHSRAKDADGADAARLDACFELFEMAGDIFGRQKLVDVGGESNIIRTDGVLERANIGKSKVGAVQRNTALGQQSAGLFQADRGHVAGRDMQAGPGKKRRVPPFPAAEIKCGGCFRRAAEGLKKAKSGRSNLARLGAEKVAVGGCVNAVPVLWKLGLRRKHDRLFGKHGGLFAVPGTIPCVTLDTAQFLLSPAGRTLTAEAGTLRENRADTLTALTRLRRSASPELAGAAWELSELRGRGAAKFGPLASQMYFVREALEQASGRGTADYHAARIKASGAQSVSDLGGGIGGDALAFARAGLRVTLYERDPVRAAFAEENARVWEMADKITVQQEDFTEAKMDTDAAWLDPARRQNSRRVSDPEAYTPPLSWLHTLAGSGVKSIGVKLSPAIDHALADPFGAELEFISESGDCREALLWLGEAQSGHKLSATVITPATPQTMTGTADKRGDWTAPTGSRYLYEPDPAVVRAHLVGTLAARLDAAAVDPQIAYLLGGTLAPTPFADTYEVLEQFAYSKKKLQEALTALNIGRVIIKKRGFPTEPDEIRKTLKLRGTEEMIVVLARVGSGHRVFLCRLLDKAV